MMLMNEKEAKAKWCPFARSYGFVGSETPVTINRQPTGPDPRSLMEPRS